MGLTARYRSLRYRTGWRLRHWWMDTESGHRANVIAIVLAALVVVIQLIRMINEANAPVPRDEPVQAVYWWVVQLIIAIVAAVVAYALRPKVEPPAARTHDSPTVQDGTACRDYGGTVWIEYDENFMLDYEVVGRDPIYSKGGKK